MAGCNCGRRGKCDGCKLIARQEAERAFFLTVEPGDKVLGYKYPYPGDLVGDPKDWVVEDPTVDATTYRPRWPLSMWERERLAMKHEPAASSSPDGYRLATCVVCNQPMVFMWHLWLDAPVMKKEIHMCAYCATRVYGAPEQPQPPVGDPKDWPGYEC